MSSPVRWRGTAVVVGSCLACWLGAAVAAADDPVAIWNRRARLRTVEVGAGSLPLVLLHGYGSSPEKWLPFCATIHVSSSRRFVFPQGPSSTSPPDGPLDGWAWWRLDLASYRRRGSLPDLAGSSPKGLEEASGRIDTLLQDVQGRLGSAPGETILGGFSQGAMIAADVAFRTDEPLRALVLLSGTIVDEKRWAAGMGRRKGLPVFIAHGRQDEVLPFQAGDRLAAKMRAAGLKVTWIPFMGGHEIPASVVTALNRFLAEVGAAP